MKWFERVFIVFGMVMIASSLGAVMRGESANLLHGICVALHGTFIFAYVELYLKRH